MAGKSLKSLHFWENLSLVLVVLLSALIIDIFLDYKFDFISYSISSLVVWLVAPIALFLELTGLRQILLSGWYKLPLFMHKGISLVCFLCTIVLSYVVLPGIIRKNYENSK